MINSTLAIQINENNPNHHLWQNNRGNYWICYTVHHPDYTKDRVRKNLRTRDLAAARRLRDEIFLSLRQGGAL